MSLRAFVTQHRIVSASAIQHRAGRHLASAMAGYAKPGLSLWVPADVMDGRHTCEGAVGVGRRLTVEP